MRIEKYPLTDNYYIIVFDGGTTNKYSLSNNNVVVNYNWVDNDFSNRRLKLDGYQMFGRIMDKNLSFFEKIIEDSGYVPEGDAKESVISFINKQGFEVTEDTWMICPKFPKKLIGKKIPIVFDLGNPNFDYGDSEFKELDVFMTPITKETKTVNFSMVIPKHLYDKCSTDPQEDLRPKHRHITSESLSYLHAHIKSLVNQAFHLRQREKDADKAKKVICINFSSGETKERDSFNFGYCGQKLNTSFNFYVCYFTGKEYYTYHKVDSGTGIGTTGVKGVIDNTDSGHKSWIKQSPKVIIDWTQEREDFLYKLEDNFRQLSVNLNSFLKDLNSDSLDKLVANNELLKLKM